LGKTQNWLVALGTFSLGIGAILTALIAYCEGQELIGRWSGLDKRELIYKVDMQEFSAKRDFMTNRSTDLFVNLPTMEIEKFIVTQPISSPATGSQKQDLILEVRSTPPLQTQLEVNSEMIEKLTQSKDKEKRKNILRQYFNVNQNLNPQKALEHYGCKSKICYR